jgi:hypothetical protein
MILGRISYLDCLVFLVFLTPQLILHVGLFRTAFWLIGALPSLGPYMSFSPTLLIMPI